MMRASCITSASLLAALLSLSACGGDKKKSTVTGSDGGMDGGMDAGMDAETGYVPDWPDATVEVEPEGCTQRECNELSNECQTATCNAKTGECDIEQLEDGSPCGSEDNDACTRPDTCLAGVCEENHVAEGQPCGPVRECEVRDTCDGMGGCTDNGYAAEGTACGDPAESECDMADSCNDVGDCLVRHAAPGTPCGPDKHFDCGGDLYGDTCGSNGTCISNGMRKPPTAPLTGIVRVAGCLRGTTSDGSACQCGNTGIMGDHPCPDRCDPLTAACLDVGDACLQ